MAFAEYELKMQARQGDGRTLKEHLKSVWRQTGRKPKELQEEPELPELYQECWQWFLRLNNKRTSNGFSINPISYQEIRAFFELQEYNPNEWELFAIDQFDILALNAYAAEQKAADKAKPKPGTKTRK